MWTKRANEFAISPVCPRYQETIVINWKCAACGSRVNPAKTWLMIDSYLRCPHCASLNVVDRSKAATVLGSTAFGVVAFWVSKIALGLSGEQAFIVLIAALLLADFLTASMRKVDIVEAAARGWRL